MTTIVALGNSQIGDRHSYSRSLFFIIALIAVILYGGLLSRNIDGNSIIEAQHIEAGGALLFSPNHLIYRPLVWLAIQTLNLLGYNDIAIHPAQIITAIASALGVGALFWLLSRYIQSRLIAIITTIGFATAWSQWVFSTDAFYITPAATIVIVALIFLSRLHDTQRPNLYLILVAIASSLAVLFWQANVCFILFVVITLIVLYHSDRRKLTKFVVLYLVLCVVIVGSFYLIASVAVLEGSWSASNFMAWLFNYGGGKLPIWGQLSLSRIVPAIRSFIASIVPLNEGLGISDLQQGRLNIAKTPSLVAMGAFILLMTVPAAYLVTKRLYRTQRSSPIVLALVGFLLYIPFIVWWDPFEAKWFVIPNIAIWTIIGLGWELVSGYKPLYRYIFFVLIIILGFATLNATVWPRHSDPGEPYLMAECIHHRMRASDLHIELFFGWGGHLEYFFNRNNFSIIAASAQLQNAEVTVEVLRQEIRDSQANGSQVYVIDPNTLPQDTLTWIFEVTGLTVQNLHILNGSPVFNCGDYAFVQVAHVGA
jgi:hypothetical protein